MDEHDKQAREVADEQRYHKRDYLFRIVLLARAEPDLPMESVVFQASQPGRIAAAPIAAAASPAQTERDEYAVRFETVTDAHARGSRETQVRIAARLRARADKEDGDAARADSLGYREDDHRHRYAASVLRAEADALEGT